MVTNSIASNAQLIVDLLTLTGDFPLRQLKVRSGLSDVDFYMSVGWLFREGTLFCYYKEGVGLMAGL
ncbi:MAG: winged helix-turn-helix domain-containing protein [Bacteroidales bacterium]